MLKRFLFLTILMAYSVRSVQAVELSNPNSTQTTKDVYQYLQTLPAKTGDKKIISGQFISWNGATAVGYNDYIQKAYDLTGKWIGILALDARDYDATPSHWQMPLDQFNQTALTHWNKGGLVTVSWHMQNPWTMSDAAYDLTGTANYGELLQPGKVANTNLIAQYDWLAAGFQQLEDAGVVVLFRPFHEMNGNYYWWGPWSRPQTTTQTEQFKLLWRHMYDYFSKTKGLNNIIWVYAPEESNFYPLTISSFYPGSEYVDIVGLDYYMENKNDTTMGGYQEALNLGKPFAITELGTPASNYDVEMITSITNKYPQATYFVAWSEQWSIKNFTDPTGFLNYPSVLNLEDIHYQQSSLVGDINRDGIVDLNDYSLLVRDFFKTSQDALEPRTDINGDGFVDLSDYSLLVKNFFKTL